MYLIGEDKSNNLRPYISATAKREILKANDITLKTVETTDNKVTLIDNFGNEFTSTKEEIFLICKSKYLINKCSELLMRNRCIYKAYWKHIKETDYAIN